MYCPWETGKKYPSVFLAKLGKGTAAGEKSV